MPAASPITCIGSLPSMGGAWSQLAGRNGATCTVCLQAQKVLRDMQPLLRDLRLRCRDEQELGPGSQARPQLWPRGGRGTAAQAAAAPVAAPAVEAGCSSQGRAAASAVAGSKPGAKSGSDSASSGSHSGSRRSRRQQGQSLQPRSQAAWPKSWDECARPSNRLKEGVTEVSGGSACMGRGERGSHRLQAKRIKREWDAADAASDSGADSSARLARPKRACPRSGLCMSGRLPGAAQAGTAAAAAAHSSLAHGPSGMDEDGAPGEGLQTEEAGAATGGAVVPMLSPGKGLPRRAVVAQAGTSGAYQRAGTGLAGTGVKPCDSSGLSGQAQQAGDTVPQQAGARALPGCSSRQSALAAGAGGAGQRAPGPAERSDEQVEAAMQDGDGSGLFTRQYVDIVLQELQAALQPQRSDGRDEHEQVGFGRQCGTS